MTASYHAVHWNRQKRQYDATLVGGVLGSVGVYVLITLITNPNVTIETLLIRATSIAAFVLLHVILCIGPLARFDTRFLPLLYNRRHLGVAMFVLAATHAVICIVQFHALGDVNPFVSVFTAYGRSFGLSDGVAQIPFEPFGALALGILFLMAATSHDFWLRNLGATFWKTLHILVYVAYGAVVVHVAYGFLQLNYSAVYPLLLGAGLAFVLGLHVAAALKERATDATPSDVDAGFHRICTVDDLVDEEGYVGVVRFDRVAVYRVGDRVYALSNACRHQAGPIGEGRLVDGLVTCPWHGWNYQPQNGISPPPFESEFIPTFPVRVREGTVSVHEEPYPLRSENSGAAIEGGDSMPLKSGEE